MEARDANLDTRPAVVDGQVVQLPTLSGLLRGSEAVPAPDRRELWNALAAAVMSEAAFETLDEELAGGRQLAEVIELDSYRPRPHELD